MKKENKIQSDIISELKELFPDSIILKNDPNYKQGIPDLVLLDREGWALLEVKRDANASHRPNQDYYVEMMDHMSFSRFVYPENRDVVVSDLIDYLED